MTAGSMPTTGRWGWYKDHEGREWQRVSTLVKKVETDTYHLDLWKQRQVAEGLALRDDLVFALKAMGKPPAEGWSKDQKKQINEICKTAAEVAKQNDGAKIGTAVHTLTERVDRGESLDAIVAGLPSVHAEGLRAYRKLIELNKWTVREIERTVVCDELDVAGTFDRVYEIPGLTDRLGEWVCQHGHNHDMGNSSVIGDVKTEDIPWRNGLHIGPQLAIYSRARRMWVPDGAGDYVTAPCVRQDVAVVVHIRDGHAHPYFVNLREGWEAAQAARVQADRESRSKRALGAAGAWFAPMPGIVEPKPAEVLTEQAVHAQYANPNRPAASEVGEVVTVGGIDFTRLVSAQDVEQIAVRGDDGMVRWTDAGDPTRQLIAEIWKAVTVDGLAILWNMTRDRGIAWSGPVAQAGDARRRQIECPQRALHTGNGKCACGWMPGIPA